MWCRGHVGVPATRKQIRDAGPLSRNAGVVADNRTYFRRRDEVRALRDEVRALREVEPEDCSRRRSVSTRSVQKFSAAILPSAAQVRQLRAAQPGRPRKHDEVRALVVNDNGFAAGVQRRTRLGGVLNVYRRLAA